MKVGLILECGPNGADKAVCARLASCIDKRLQVISRTMDDKERLLTHCGPVASQLLNQGCNRVVIVWDLRPAWPDTKSKPCLKEERQQIWNSLHFANVRSEAVYLVCIQQELEAWLLADERSLGAVLSTAERPVRINRRRNVHQIQGPKAVLISLFKEYIGRPYVDRRHAMQIVESMPDLKRLEKIDSFRRFQKSLTD